MQHLRVNFRGIWRFELGFVTPSEKSSINTNRKSTTRLSMSPRSTSYVVPKPPKGAQKRKVSHNVQNLNNKPR